MGMLKKDKFDYFLNDIKREVAILRSECKTNSDTFDIETMKKARKRFMVSVNRNFPE